ncbi:MAG: ArnT family glycosyltransferase [Planctomycetota bacterium]|jgi:4-amino-4-deoxy-L-arabinose transferase-like glycosyltransferase
MARSEPQSRLTPSTPSALSPLLIAAFVAYALLVGLALANDAISHQDESYYLAASRTMLDTGGYLVPEFEGDARIKKPILYYWLMLPAQVLLGHGFWSSRLLSLACGLGLLAVTWKVSAFFFEERSRRVAAVWMLASTDIVYRYAHYAVPEMTLTLMLTSAHWAFLSYDRAATQRAPARRYLITFYGLMGLAFMTKGPVGIALPLLTAIAAYLVGRRPRAIPKLFSIPGVLLLLAIICPWYVALVVRVGGETVLSMMLSEVAPRVGLGLGSLAFFYFVPLCLLYYLPWTLFLIAAAVEWVQAKRVKAGLAELVQSFPFVWFATYFVFYSLFIVEKHQWYALQWAVPLVLMLAQMVNLRETVPARPSLWGAFASAGAIVAVIVLPIWWFTGGILGSALAAVVTAVIIAGGALVLRLADRRPMAPPGRVAILACVVMVAHAAVFQLLLPTTQVRPVAEFARYLERQEVPFRLLVGDGYFQKKLPRYNLPRLEEQFDVWEEPAFSETWQRERPDFVICRQPQLDGAPPALQQGYEVVASGYVRPSDDRDGSAGTWLSFVKTRDPQKLLDVALLLRRERNQAP